MNEMNEDIENCLKVLAEGGTIVYPTDTIWGIGCDATNAEAVDRVFKLKQRPDSRALIVLVADERDVLKYVAHPDPLVFDYLNEQTRPTTVIFDGAIGLADNLIASDGSVAIRICKDEFCRHLLKRFRKPIVSTSANISGSASPQKFSDISPEIIEGTDYVVNYRQDDLTPSSPSSIIRFSSGKITVIR